MLDSILSMKEYSRYSKGLFSFVGFKIKWLEYENVPRVAGKTKWSFFKLLKYAFEGIIAFSTRPLLFSLYISGPLGVWACTGAGAAHSTIISSNAMMPQERFENLPARIDLWNNDANVSALYPF